MTTRLLIYHSDTSSQGTRLYVAVDLPYAGTELSCCAVFLNVHASARQSIFDTLASFGAAWTEKQVFALQLLSSLLADADKSASRASPEPLSSEEQYSLLAYVGCSAAICDACALTCSSDPAGDSAFAPISSAMSGTQAQRDVMSAHVFDSVAQLSIAWLVLVCLHTAIMLDSTVRVQDLSPKAW